MTWSPRAYAPSRRWLSAAQAQGRPRRSDDRHRAHRGGAPQRSVRASRSRSTPTANGTCQPASASARARSRSTYSGSKSRCGSTTSARTRHWRASTTIPIALGEQLYTRDAFDGFIAARRRAVRAARRHAPGRNHRIHPGRRHRPRTPAPGRRPCRRHGPGARPPVLLASRDGDARVHPMDQGLFAEPIRVEGGYYVRPQMPGAGCTLTEAAMSAYAKP